MQTRRYTIVKIPHPVKKIPEKKRVSIAEFVGILKDVPAFKGKTSVQVQHMTPILWSSHHGISTPSS